jgi:AraC-like DNA-binding protein
MHPTRRHGIKTGLYAQVRQYFIDNPDEELTYEAIMIKFDVTKRSAFRVVYALTELGMLEHVHVVRLRAGRHLRERQEEPA